MELLAMFRALLLGFSVAAPVGPIGVLVIRRTLAGGLAIGLVTGLGAAVADAIYATIAGFGLTALAGTLVGAGPLVRLAGGGFLCYLGLRTFATRVERAERAERAGRTERTERTVRPAPGRPARVGRPAAAGSTGSAGSAAPGGRATASAFASSFLLTISNPMTILSFAAMLGGLGLGGAGRGRAAAAVMVAGVFTGSALWWLLLSGGVGLARSRVTPPLMRWVNRVSGAVILGFGIYVVAAP